MIEGFAKAYMRRFSEIDRLENLKQKLKPASLRGENKCVKCGFCCHKRTCVPTPKELQEIALFLHLDLKDMIKKYFAFDKNSVLTNIHLKPVGENTLDLAGKFIPSDRTWNEGKCVFLKNSKCKIYEVRPDSARILRCWEEQNEEEFKKMNERINKSWENNEIVKEFNINLEECE